MKKYLIFCLLFFGCFGQLEVKAYDQNNDVNVSINHIEARIKGENPSDSDVLQDLLCGIVVDSTIGMITGSLIDVESNRIIMSSSGKMKFGSKLINSLKYKNNIHYVDDVLEVCSIAVDEKVKRTAKVLFHKETRDNTKAYVKTKLSKLFGI